MKVSTGLVAALTILLAPAPRLHAATARELLDQAKALDDGPRHWNDRTQKMKLTIVDGHGGERLRELEVTTKHYPKDEDRNLSFFLAPPEVKGTGFLQWT